jgi:hypothetical protein
MKSLPLGVNYERFATPTRAVWASARTGVGLVHEEY